MRALRHLTTLLLMVLACYAQAGDPFNGHRIYGEHCISCHGDDGSGEMVAIPNFRRGEGLLKADYDIVETLKRGLGAMPAYQGLLSDSELVDVITYTRTLQ